MLDENVSIDQDVDHDVTDTFLEENSAIYDEGLISKAATADYGKLISKATQIIVNITKSLERLITVTILKTVQNLSMLITRLSRTKYIRNTDPVNVKGITGKNGADAIDSTGTVREYLNQVLKFQAGVDVLVKQANAGETVAEKPSENLDFENFPKREKMEVTIQANDAKKNIANASRSVKDISRASKSLLKTTKMVNRGLIKVRNVGNENGEQVKTAKAFLLAQKQVSIGNRMIMKLASFTISLINANVFAISKLKTVDFSRKVIDKRHSKHVTNRTYKDSVRKAKDEIDNES